MVKINANYAGAKKNYLFIEIAKGINDFRAANPDKKLISLSIGNTTLPLTPTIVKGLEKGVANLTDEKTYTGYGDEQGNSDLRAALADWYKKRNIRIEASEIFISDGAKPDTANIQSIFATDSVVAIQDPSYPVYVETSMIAGRRIVAMPCTPENGFVPELPKEDVDLIYICSPNNPTGAVLTKDTLKKFVDYANENGSIIIFDPAYFAYIKDPNFPKSIYEIPGAKTCAIEVNSFSKWAGFTGVRLGWTVVPFSLKGDGVAEGQINAVWKRRQTTMFNGASNIAQSGGIAALTQQGQKESQTLVDYYMENAKIIEDGLKKIGYEVYGGENAPYLWVKTPGNIKSWDFFNTLLNEVNIVVTPGVGFGPSGEGFVRISAFGNREDAKEAVRRIEGLKIMSQ